MGTVWTWYREVVNPKGCAHPERSDCYGHRAQISEKRTPVTQIPPLRRNLGDWRAFRSATRSDCWDPSSEIRKMWTVWTKILEIRKTHEYSTQKCTFFGPKFYCKFSKMSFYFLAVNRLRFWDLPFFSPIEGFACSAATPGHCDLWGGGARRAAVSERAWSLDRGALISFFNFVFAR